MAKNTDNMSPNASPGQASKTGVRRVNNVPIYIIGFLVVIFLIIMLVVAKDRSDAQNEQAEETKKFAGNTAMFANEVIDSRSSGIIEPAKPVILELPDDVVVSLPEEIIIARPTASELDVPPTPPSLPNPNPNTNNNMPNPDDELREHIRQTKMQMLDLAIRAKTSVQFEPARSGGATSFSGLTQNGQSATTRAEMLAQIERVRQMANSARDSDPTAAYQAQLANVQAGLSETSNEASPDASFSLAVNNPEDSAPQSNNADRWKLNGKISAPQSPYELRAGFVIPGTLISGINSDIPGQIIAQVSQNVYDSATGKHLLVPQGSRLIGIYAADVGFGQSRLLVAWQRIVFPDGKALDLGEMPGSNGAGYAGLTDKVNNHYFRTFASAVLMSAVVAGINISQDSGDTSSGTSQRSSDALSESLGQQLGEVTAQLVSKNLNVSPTIEVRPGYLFNVTVTKDLVFSKPYQSFDY